MKKIILLFLVLHSVTFYAQQMGGGAPQGGQGSGDQERPKFVASDIAGIFYYEIDEVISKLKIKDEEKEFQVSKALRKYNDKIKELSFLNSKNFQEIDVFVNKMLSSPQTAPKELNEEEKIDVKGIISAVRKEVKENEEQLNKVMEELLSSKQNKKWLKYQKKEKRSLMPKRPSSGNNSAGGGRMGSSGMGGRGMRR